ncbi:hypothetical protein AA0112_g2021 [Alternaria arborescens]|nr:hypothetical protein AA0112_g2021 [Alternaria arborescens]
MKFLATIIPLTFLAATVRAGDCMKAPFQCKGMSLTCTTAILVTLFTTTASATECTIPVLCTRSVGKSRLIANIPGFEEFDDSYSSIECAQVDCERTCRRSLESCRVLCDGDEDLPRCAVGVSPLPRGRHGILHTIPTNYTTIHLSKNNTHPPIRVV